MGPEFVAWRAGVVEGSGVSTHIMVPTWLPAQTSCSEDGAFFSHTYRNRMAYQCSVFVRAGLEIENERVPRGCVSTLARTGYRLSK